MINENTMGHKITITLQLFHALAHDLQFIWNAETMEQQQICEHFH